jgi:hypothetical protein
VAVCPTQFSKPPAKIPFQLPELLVLNRPKFLNKNQPDRNAGAFRVAPTAGIIRLLHPRLTTETAEMNDKQDCIESIVRILERTAEWRKTALARFDDPRNSKAAETLEQLAVDASGLTEEQWNALKPHYACH